MKIPGELKIDEDLYKVLSSIANYKGSDEDDELLELARVDPESFALFLVEIGKTSDPVAQSILERARARQGEAEDAGVSVRQQHAHGHAA